MPLERVVLRLLACIARRTASSIKSGFIQSPQHQTGDVFTGGVRCAPQIFYKQPCVRLQAARSPVLGEVSVMAENSRNSPNKGEDQPLMRPDFPVGILRSCCANLAQNFRFRPPPQAVLRENV